MTVLVNNRQSLPSASDLKRVFAQKHAPLEHVGWGPRQRQRYGYYLPSDIYEATVFKHVVGGCRWIDVGGGHNIFPDNAALARDLVSRCSWVVAVDPDPNTSRNPFVHERVQSLIEDYVTDSTFDLATLRMVVEHVADPARVVRALHALLRPGGRAIVLTVNLRSPITVVSRLTPFWAHYRIKRLFWGGEERDTFPVQYRMNTRPVLRRWFEQHGFREAAFTRLDDLSTFGRFRYLNAAELRIWRVFRRMGIAYPENCLLGIYERL